MPPMHTGTGAGAVREPRGHDARGTPAWAGHALVGLALAILVLQVVRTTWVSDDAFITLRTVDNVVHGYGLRWNVAERVQTFTHPLWLALLVPVYALVRDPYYAATLLALATTGLTAWWLAFRSGLTRAHAAAALVVLALSNAFVDYSTSGLENPLTHFLLLLFTLELLRDAAWDERAPRLGLAGGLLALNRLDLLIFVVPALAVAAWRARAARARVRLALGLAPLVLWEVFAAFYYGSVYPNTTLAKLQTGVPAGELFAQGLAYLGNSLAADPLTLTVVVAALVVAALRREPGPLLLGAGVVLYLAAVVKVGGDFMSGRFLTGAFLVAVVLLAHTPAPRWAPCAAVLLALALGAAGQRHAWSRAPVAHLSEADAIGENGIADERRYYFKATGLFNGAPGWSRPVGALRRRGADLACDPAGLAIEGVVGIAGFYAGPRVHVVDVNALGDPLLARLPMVAADPEVVARRPRNGRTWRIGHFLRNVPRGYLRGLVGGNAAVESGGEDVLARRVRLLTRAPLFAPGRAAEVAASALRLERPRPGARPAYVAPDWQEVREARPDSVEAVYQEGETLYAARRFGDALEAYRAVLVRCPAHTGALFGAGIASLELKDLAGAEAYGRRAVAAAPDAETGAMVLAWALRGQGRMEAAAAALDELAARNPQFTALARGMLEQFRAPAR